MGEVYCANEIKKGFSPASEVTLIMKKTLACLLAALLAALLLVSCSSESTTTESGDSSATAAEAGAKLERSSVEVVLNGDSVTCSSKSVSYTDGKVLINSTGTYTISGTLNDAGIEVNCVNAGETHLVLKGVNITHSDGPCIDFVKSQGGAFITVYEGTENTLTDGEDYTFANPEDTEPDSAVFSKENLVINGTGTLTVNGNYSCGIVSKDGLTIDNGTLIVNAVRHGIKGKDNLIIKGGDITVNAEREGIKSTNEKTELVGFVQISGGKLTINSADEAIQALSRVTFEGGEVAIRSTNNGIRCDGPIEFTGGTVTIDADDNALNGLEIVKNDACTVTISGNPYNG